MLTDKWTLMPYVYCPLQYLKREAKAFNSAHTKMCRMCVIFRQELCRILWSTLGWKLWKKSQFYWASMPFWLKNFESFANFEHKNYFNKNGQDFESILTIFRPVWLAWFKEGIFHKCFFLQFSAHFRLKQSWIHLTKKANSCGNSDEIYLAQNFIALLSKIELELRSDDLKKRTKINYKLGAFKATRHCSALLKKCCIGFPLFLENE